MMKTFKVIKTKIELASYWIKFWWLEFQFEQEVKSNINMNTAFDSVKSVEQDVDQKLANGVYNLKHAARQAAKTNNKTLDSLLSQVDDMFDLARQETAEETRARKIKESIFIFKGSDIKTDKDKDKMVDKRIEMYYDLQTKRQQRQLLSSIRKAKMAGDKELHAQLLEEYNGKYGRKNS